MIVENTLRTAKIKIFYAVILANLVALTLYNVFEHNWPWIEWTIWGLMIVMALIYIGMLILHYNYFYIEKKNKKLMFKYYTAHPFGRKYKAFDIPVTALHSYKIQYSMGGLKKRLLLEAKTPKGIFKFPPISISLLNKKEINNLEYILKK